MLADIPLAELPTDHGHCPEKVEVRFNTREQRETFKRLRQGLRETNARTNDGVPVHNNASVLRWLMEALAQE